MNESTKEDKRKYFSNELGPVQINKVLIFAIGVHSSVKILENKLKKN